MTNANEIMSIGIEAKNYILDEVRGLAIEEAYRQIMKQAEAGFCKFSVHRVYATAKGLAQALHGYTVSRELRAYLTSEANKNSAEWFAGLIEDCMADLLIIANEKNMRAGYISDEEAMAYFTC